MYFSIFKNTQKKQGSNQPDYNILCEGYEGAGWIRKSKRGNSYISCKLEKKHVKQQVNEAPNYNEDLNEEVFF